MFAFMKKMTSLLPAASTIPGRAAKMPVPAKHFVNGHPLQPPFPQGIEQAVFGMGCFWGAERLFWQVNGVYTTAVGYAGGETLTANGRLPRERGVSQFRARNGPLHTLL